MRFLIWVIAEIVFLFLGGLTDNIAFYGIAFMCIGIMIFVAMGMGFSLDDRAVIIIASFFTLFGVLMVISPIVESRTALGEKFTGFVFSIGMGIIFGATGIFNISKKFTCREPVEAIFKHATKQVSRGIGYYIPIFSYRYHNRSYEVSSGELYKGRQIKRKYVTGNTYKIYVNKKQPWMIRSKKGIGTVDLFCIFFCIFCICLPFFYYF